MSVVCLSVCISIVACLPVHRSICFGSSLVRFFFFFFVIPPVVSVPCFACLSCYRLVVMSVQSLVAVCCFRSSRFLFSSIIVSCICFSVTSHCFFSRSFFVCLFVCPCFVRLSGLFFLSFISHFVLFLCSCFGLLKVEFEGYVAAGTVMKSYIAILTLLLRLRQASRCNIVHFPPLFFRFVSFVSRLFLDPFRNRLFVPVILLLLVFYNFTSPPPHIFLVGLSGTCCMFFIFVLFYSSYPRRGGKHFSSALIIS